MGRDLPFPAPPAPPGDLLDGDRVRPVGADVPFEAFAREQIERVPAIARRMRRPEDLVRDWMHEGLARLWEQEPPVEPAVRDRWLSTAVYRLHVDDLRARRRAERHRSEVLVAVGHAGGAGGNGGSGGHGAGGHGGHSVGVGLVGIADLPSPFTWTAGQWGAGGDGGGGVPETLRGYAGVESPQLVFDP